MFDPVAIEAPATKENPKQYAVGIDYVFVNGKAVIDNGKSTGTLSGRSLRRGKD